MFYENITKNQRTITQKERKRKLNPSVLNVCDIEFNTHHQKWNGWYDDYKSGLILKDKHDQHIYRLRKKNHMQLHTIDMELLKGCRKNS